MPRTVREAERIDYEAGGAADIAFRCRVSTKMPLLPELRNRVSVPGFYKDAAPTGAAESVSVPGSRRMSLLPELRNRVSVPGSTKMPLLPELRNRVSAPG